MAKRVVFVNKPELVCRSCGNSPLVLCPVSGFLGEFFQIFLDVCGTSTEREEGRKTFLFASFLFSTDCAVARSRITCLDVSAIGTFQTVIRVSLVAATSAATINMLSCSHGFSPSAVFQLFKV